MREYLFHFDIISYKLVLSKLEVFVMKIIDKVTGGSPTPALKNKKLDTSTLAGDVMGGSASMLVALPSAIAFGLIIFAPLGKEFSGQAALGGIIGTVMLGLITPLVGGTKRLVTAPCAPAAAVLSVFVAEMVAKGSVPKEIIPAYITIVALLSASFQILVGYLGGGKIIKYIPYPVVAGYLSGVGVLIFSAQLPKMLGITEKINFWQSLYRYDLWQWESILIGSFSILAMVFAGKITKKIPGSIIALLTGVCTYFLIGIYNNSLFALEGNKFIVGAISASIGDLTGTVTTNFSHFASIDFLSLTELIIPFLTLSILLSIDTLKTCVVLDALTYSRHNSNREIIGQGFGNIGSALVCGIPGAGTMGATLVNLNSGAKTKYSGFFVGVMSLLVLLLFGNLIAWIPISALAGILMVVGIRMIDKKSFALLRSKLTYIDFLVILAVIVAAVGTSLITAAGVGIGLSIILFLREQIRSSVIRRKFTGDKKFSKKIRMQEEMETLSAHGSKSLIIELQGQLFFGTTDQLLNELEDSLKSSRFLILDMKRVTSIDFTAVNMLKQIMARLKTNNGTLIFSSVPLSLPTGQNIKDYLRDLGLTETENLKFFDSLDDSLEYSENELLKEFHAESAGESEALPIEEIELFYDFPAEALKVLSEAMQKKSYNSGDIIFSTGEKSDEIFFIARGSVKIVLPLSSGVYHTLVSFTRGNFFGDMSFLDEGVRSANALADGNVELFILSRKSFDAISASNSTIAQIFFERLALTIANRLRHSNVEVKALQEG